MTEPKSVATSFKKGRKKTGGRKAGVPNKSTRFLREAIILAAEAVGSDGYGKDGLVGYLMKVANKNTAGFCSLLGRVMPLQTEPVKEKKRYTVEEAKAELKRRNLFHIINWEAFDSVNKKPPDSNPVGLVEPGTSSPPT